MLMIFPILFILLISVLLLIVHLFDNNIGAGKILVYGWGTLFFLYLIGSVINLLTSKTTLDKEDYYGEYIVNRNFFKGEQADWQYNHFRFEIKKNDSIYFYETEGELIKKVHRGIINTSYGYKSKRLKISMNETSHHIVANNPTTHRSAWSFYLTFYSSKFNTVFFKKGKWCKID